MSDVCGEKRLGDGLVLECKRKPLHVGDHRDGAYLWSKGTAARDTALRAEGAAAERARLRVALEAAREKFGHTKCAGFCHGCAILDLLRAEAMP